ncbi:MAG: hypothetical protein PWQ82_766 [Thermosediminibacterales bacterium]|nr:hypothetical protein [Thermosediminibacterales bacterium]
MAEVIAGLLAAAVSLGLNNLIVRIRPETAVTYVAPLIEEITKTFGGYCLGGSIFFVHVVFGIIEAFYDYAKSRKIIGLTAAMFSIISHSIFGYITVVISKIFDSLFLGVLAAFLAHSIWNWIAAR